MLVVEKFPEILFEGRKVVWDPRQTDPGAQSLVIICDDKFSTDQYIESLKKFSGEKVSSGGIFQKRKIDTPRKLLAEICAQHFSSPSSKFRLYGVTGTNGKSSCAHIGAYLCSQGNKTSAEIGTFGLRLWSNGKIIETVETAYTTPDSPMLQSLFAQLAKRAVNTVFIEVSSHALDLNRAWASDFDAVLFSNLSQDHLDFHKTLEDYFLAKQKLFSEHLNQELGNYLTLPSQKHKFAFLNGESIYSQRIPVNKNATKTIVDLKETLRNSELSTHASSFNAFGRQWDIPLIGIHNIENFCLVLSAIENTTLEKVSTLVAAQIPQISGRLECLRQHDRCVYIDYAHTPDALEKSLQSLRKLTPKESKLIVVFGCGGDRDRTKRPLMAKVAEIVSDVLVVTSDNPRSEDPNKIIDEIYSGLHNTSKARKEVDRRKAIRSAVAMSKSGDSILIAGKGHETFQIIGKNKVHFSDREEAAKALLELGGIAKIENS